MARGSFPAVPRYVLLSRARYNPLCPYARAMRCPSALYLACYDRCISLHTQNAAGTDIRLCTMMVCAYTISTRYTVLTYGVWWCKTRRPSQSVLSRQVDASSLRVSMGILDPLLVLKSAYLRAYTSTKSARVLYPHIAIFQTISLLISAYRASSLHHPPRGTTL